MPDESRFAMETFFGATDAGQLIDYIPHCRRLGMYVVSMGPCRARVRLPWREELVGDPVRRVVFGGVVTTLLDHASGIAVAASLEELVPIATLDLRIDYLRAAATGLDLFGESVCYKHTSTIAFVRATAWYRSPDDPFASCLATFMLGSSAVESPLQRAVRERRGRGE